MEKKPNENDKAGVKYPHYTGNATIGGKKRKLRHG